MSFRVEFLCTRSYETGVEKFLATTHRIAEQE